MKRSWERRDSASKKTTGAQSGTNSNEDVKKHKGESSSDDNNNDNKQVELHPLLRDSAPVTVIPKSFNPLKQQKNKIRSGLVVNPYLDAMDLGLNYQKPRRALALVEHGKYIERGNELRAKLKEENDAKEKLELLRSKGLAPDAVLGEQYFRPSQPPLIEWWDKALIKDKNYNHLDEPDRITYIDPNDEENPISVYIQHPVPVRAPWEKHLPPLQPLYLTKKELKRIRKNERAVKHKEKQDRISVGLDPPPPPKVKLKNLMNVLTNDAIKNPTEVEMRVRKEIDERRVEHEKVNEDRKLTSEQRHEKEHLKKEKDLQKGYYSVVYKIDRLVNPQHYYKVDINAKQLELKGMLLRPRDGQGFSLVIAEGGGKSIRQYRKLLERRINWKENALPRQKKIKDVDSMQVDSREDDLQLEDLSSNKCTILWDGQLKELHFQKWTAYDINDEEALNLLGKYRLDNYWRQAASLE